MTFQNWLGRTFGSQALRAPRRSGLRFAPKAESLEERAVPAVLTVNSIADNAIASDGLVTLREAISASVNRTATDLNQTGDGTDTIRFSPAIDGQTILLSNSVNDLAAGSTMPGPSAFRINNSTNLTLDGETGLTKGITIARDTTAKAFRLFYIASGSDLTVESLTLRGGLAKGGSAPVDFFGAGGGGAAGFGGAIFNDGQLTIQNSTLTGNKAQGGAGGGGQGKGQGNGGGGLGADGEYAGTSLPENGGAGGGPNGGAAGSFGGQGGNGAFGGGGGGGQVVSKLGVILSKGPGGNGGFGGGGGGGGSGNITTGENGGNGGFGGGGGGAGGGSYFGTAGAGGFGGGPGVAGTGGGGAGMGGAIFNHSGRVVITNSTLTGNTAVGGLDGGGGTAGNGYGIELFNYNGDLSVTYGTLSTGGGNSGFAEILNLGNGAGNKAVARINDSILGSSGLALGDLTLDVINGGAAEARGTNNLIGSTFNSGGLADFANTVTGDPLLDPLKNNGGRTQTLALLPGSPATDGGNGDLFRAYFDQRGFARDTISPDIGAFEGLVNSAPTDIALSNAGIAENAGANAVIGTLTGTDPNAGDTLTFSLPTGLGDNAAFNIGGTTLRANASFDFETKSSYSITVRATDSGGLTFDKAFAIAVTDVNEAPSNLRVTAVDNTGVTLAWVDHSLNPSVVYRLQAATDFAFTNIVSTTNLGPAATAGAVGGLRPDTIYFLRITAVYAAGPLSAPLSAARTTAVPAAPAAPSNLTVTAVGSTTVGLSWIDHPSNETGYRLQAATDYAFTNVVAGADFAAGTAAGTLAGLQPDAIYFFRVSAFNAAGSAAAPLSAARTAAAVVAGLPAAPSDLHVYFVSSSSVSLSWTDNAADATFYLAQASTDYGFRTNVISETLPANSTSATFGGLASHTPYFLRISAGNTAGTAAAPLDAAATA